MRNVGYADLVVGTISITGTNANQFTIQNDNVSNETIIPGGSATLQVVFTPTSTGAKSATLNIPSNDPDEATVLVSLSGSGAAEGAVIPPTPANFSVTSLDLSSAQVEPGSYTISVDGLTKEFSVAALAPSWLSRYWWTILIGLVVIGLLLFFFRWWRAKKAVS